MCLSIGNGSTKYLDLKAIREVKTKQKKNLSTLVLCRSRVATTPIALNDMNVIKRLLILLYLLPTRKQFWSDIKYYRDIVIFIAV